MGADTPPIFKPDANVKPVSEIKPPASDPRRAKVHAVHTKIAQKVRDGSIYRGQ